MKTHFYTDERTFWHNTGVQALFIPVGGWVEPPAGSYGADTPGSKRRILNLIRASGLDKKLTLDSASAATMEDLARIHPQEYLDKFKALSDKNGGELGTFAPFSKGGFDIAALSAGLAIEAVDSVVSGRADNAYALCRPAGHHCMAHESMGFCLLANIPIAIEAAKAKHGINKVAIVDWDVHHGNGTQDIYYHDPSVLTISVHQDKCFPPGYSGFEERGEGGAFGRNLNVPLPAGSGHNCYLYAFEQLVLPALRDFSPELIVVASGLDANATDPLARQLLYSESYRQLTKMMMQVSGETKAKLAFVHEGGYSEAYVPFCGQAILETLSKTPTLVEDPEIDFFELQQPCEFMDKVHRQWVDDLVSRM